MHPIKEQVERATESIIARAVTRFGMPLLMGVLVFLGAEMRDKVEEQGKAIGDVRTQLTTMNNRIDWSILDRLSNVERQIEQLRAHQREADRKAGQGGSR
jgi:hypothetical protein